MKDNLWPNLNEEVIESNDSIKILRNQARYIGDMTKNAVKGTFTKIKYIQTSTSKMVETLGVLSESFRPVYSEEIDPELDGKINAEEWYQITKYKFEIYSDKYRFRIFILEHRVEFPIFVVPDDGIKEELNLSSKIEINSNAELTNCIQSIFSSKKLARIINRMRN